MEVAELLNETDSSYNSFFQLLQFSWVLALFSLNLALFKLSQSSQLIILMSHPVTVSLPDNIPAVDDNVGTEQSVDIPNAEVQNPIVNPTVNDMPIRRFTRIRKAPERWSPSFYYVVINPCQEGMAIEIVTSYHVV